MDIVQQSFDRQFLVRWYGVIHRNKYPRFALNDGHALTASLEKNLADLSER